MARATNLVIGAAAAGCIGLAVLLGSGASATLAQPGGAGPQPGAGGQGFGQMLVEALRSVDGCLGAETAQFTNGKLAIFGWFEDAEAARRWYYHPVHARVMRVGGDDPDRPKPMSHVPAGVPVMVIATVRPSEHPLIPGFPIPIDQISIELFTPAPGGAYVSGRLSPEGFKVDHMRKLGAEEAR